jgi:hypothetical protein
VASIASVDDLETWLGVEIENVARADAILAAASTLASSRTGQAWVDADGEQLEDVDDDDFEAVKSVVVLVAARVWLNPRGATQQATGPFSESVAAWAASGLSLTEAEIEMLPISESSARPALWTLATTRADSTSDLLDIHLSDGSTETIAHVPIGEVNW